MHFSCNLCETPPCLLCLTTRKIRAKCANLSHLAQSTHEVLRNTLLKALKSQATYFSIALFKSLIKSALVSSPILRRTVFGVMPALLNSASLSCECVVE